MKPLCAIVVAILVIAANAHPENIEDVKELPQNHEPIVEAEESAPQARTERCSACSGTLSLKSHNDVLAALQSLPSSEVHTQESFEECSSEKGCAGIKLKDGKLVQKYGDLDAFKAAATAGSSSGFQFQAAGSKSTFEGGLKGAPFWWMGENSPFKNTGLAGAGHSQKFSKFQSSSFTSSGNSGGAGLDLSSNPFLNGEFSKLNTGFTSAGGNFAGSQGYDSSSAASNQGAGYGAGYAASQGSAFGSGAQNSFASNSQGSAFGGGAQNSAFGAGAQNSVFGAGAQNSLGSTSQGSAFGAATQNSLGSTSQGSAYGSSAQNSLGSTSQGSAFGAATQNTLGSTSQGSAYGAGAQNSLGSTSQGSAFGSASQNSFGSNSQGNFAGSQNGYGQSGLAGAQGGLGGGQNSFNSFSSSSKFATGYTGSSPTPFAATGSNVNLIQNSQKSEYDQQTQQNIDELFQSTGNVQAVGNSGGDLQQTCSGQGYICVHKAQCNNGVVNTNGGSPFQANTQKQYCNSRTEVCCRLETSLLAGAGSVQGTLGVGSATFTSNQGSGQFSQTGQNSFGASSGYGASQSSQGSNSFNSVNRGATSGFGTNTNQFSGTGTSQFGSSFGSNTNKFAGTAFGSTISPTTNRLPTNNINNEVYKSTSQSNFVETDSFSSGSENSGIFRPGSGPGLKPGVPYLPPVDASTSASNIIPTAFVTTPRPFSTPRPISTPRPFSTPRPNFIPPVSSTSAPGYLPPVEPLDGSESRPTYVEGGLVLDDFQNPIRNPSINNEIPVGCAAALKCTPIEYCTAEGVMSNTTVYLNREQEAYRVPLTDCKDIETGRIGKCCRDPYYTDPWPVNQLGKWVPDVFGGNDGKYVPDSRGSPNNPRPVVTARPPVTGGVLLNNFRTTPKTPLPQGPNQVTPGYPSSTGTPFVQKTQFNQGSFSQRGQGQFGVGGQGQFGQGSSFSQTTSSFGRGQTNQAGVGQTVTQGQGLQTNQGAGVSINQGSGQVIRQGSGFGINRGQGIGVTQGTGQTVSQERGTTLTQTGFEVQRGQGVGVTQGGGFTVSQGEGVGVVQGTGVGVRQGQGYSVTQGSGQYGTQGQGQVVTQGIGQTTKVGGGFGVSQSGGFSLTQGQGSAVSQGVGFGASQGQGTAISQGGGFGVSQSKGVGISQGSGYGVSQNRGVGISQGSGYGVSQGQGIGVSQGGGFGVVQSSGFGIRQGQGSGIRQGVGFGVTQDSGLGLGFGQGQTLLQGQGQALVQGRGEEETEETVNRVVLSRYSGAGQCGIQNPQKPYGNHNDLEVDFAEIPWQAMVLLQTNKSLLCGGVITRPDIVVTTASCVEGLVAQNVLIKGGEWKLGIDEEPLPFQIVQVKHILRHPFYKSGSLKYDAAVLVLNENLRLAKNIWPICLPSASDTLDAFYNGAGECIVTGWGKVVLQAHLLGSIMHGMNVSLISPGECQNKLELDYPHLLDNYDEDSCVCGQPTNPANNICKVDVGSALACTTGDGSYVMRGVYSWESNCQVGNQLAAFYKFDIEWYEWSIGQIESVRFAKYSKTTITRNKVVSKVSGSRITSSVKGSSTSGVKTFGVQGQDALSKTFGNQIQSGLETFGVQGQGQAEIKKFGSQSSSQSGEFSQLGSTKLTESGSKFNAESAENAGINLGSEVGAPLSKTFTATFTEKKFFQSEPKIVTFTTKPEIVTFTTKPEYYTFTTKPKIFTYTTKPKIIPFTTKPQFINYEASGQASVTDPKYVSPSLSFSEVVGAKHTHSAQCKCLENGKK